LTSSDYTNLEEGREAVRQVREELRCRCPVIVGAGGGGRKHKPAVTAKLCFKAQRLRPFYGSNPATLCFKRQVRRFPAEAAAVRSGERVVRNDLKSWIGSFVLYSCTRMSRSP